MQFLCLLLSFSYQFLFLKNIIILNLIPKKIHGSVTANGIKVSHCV